MGVRGCLGIALEGPGGLWGAPSGSLGKPRDSQGIPWGGLGVPRASPGGLWGVPGGSWGALGDRWGSPREPSSGHGVPSENIEKACVFIVFSLYCPPRRSLWGSGGVPWWSPKCPWGVPWGPEGIPWGPEVVLRGPLGSRVGSAFRKPSETIGNCWDRTGNWKGPASSSY